MFSLMASELITICNAARAIETINHPRRSKPHSRDHVDSYARSATTPQGCYYLYITPDLKLLRSERTAPDTLCQRVVYADSHEACSYLHFRDLNALCLPRLVLLFLHSSELVAALR